MRSILGLFAGIIIISQAAFAQGKSISIALVGDSTVADKSGWGVAFAERFNDKTQVVNFAVGGRSSRSWYDEQRLPAALESNPDYVLIQFGHNDQKGKGPERETDPATSYRDFLKLYVEEFRKVGARPVILSSVTRRKFNDNGMIATTLTPWAQSARAEAEELNVAFIDLHIASILLHNEMGPEASMGFNYQEGDTTHFNEEGAAAIANLVIEGLIAEVPELSSYLK